MEEEEAEEEEEEEEAGSADPNGWVRCVSRWMRCIGSVTAAWTLRLLIDARYDRT